MNNQQLFVAFVYQLGKLSDAVILHALLEQGADETEVCTSAAQMSQYMLSRCVTRQQVQRGLARLSEQGLIEVRAQPNWRTCIRVKRDAVLALLNKPLDSRLPGLREETFPFLAHVPDGE